jgi:rSAM/selenodomain-associated transferase 2
LTSVRGSRKLSIIIPCLNEEALIGRTLSSLQDLRRLGHEIIVVDGESRDQTCKCARGLADRIIVSGPGRARQMNSGARAAGGDILLFLHADSILPDHAVESITSGLERSGRGWGRFDVRLSGSDFLFRVIGFLMNVRSRWSGIATGDQGIFVQKKLFTDIGGFPEIELMEDIALSKALKRRSRPLCLSERIITSSRRWEQNAIVRTVLTMWFLRLAYALGADPRGLAERYGRLKG